MNISLISQNLILILSVIVTGSLIYIILRLDKSWRLKYIPAILIISLLSAFALDSIVAHETESALPLSIIAMILPTTLALWLLVIVFIHRLKIKLFTALSILCCLVFSLALINSYYRYFPTLYSVFNENGIKQLSQDRQVLTKYSSKQPAVNQSTIETNLNNIGQTTNGSLYSLNIPGTVSKFTPRTAYVYVPAIASSNVSLPVIILTAGYPGQTNNWIDSGIITALNNFAARHEGITPYVFMVDNTGSLTNDTECVNSPRGNVETYLTVDVPNYIKAHFNVEAGPSHWAIGGLSLGGMCGIMLTLRHPNLFHYFLDFGGEIGPEVGTKDETIAKLFSGSEANWAAHQPSLLLSKNSYPDLGGFFGDGKNDYLIVTSAINQLYNQSKEAKMNVIYESIDGEHTFNVWEQNFTDSLPWISNQLGATQCGSGCYL